MTSRVELEQCVMEVLGMTNCAQSVADVPARSLENCAGGYTVMTVLDRLAKKHRVTRTMSGRLAEYVPSMPRPTYVAGNMFASRWSCCSRTTVRRPCGS